MWQKKFHITDADRDWVKENFRWLIRTHGYPSRYYKPVLFTKEFFPETLASSQIAIDPLINDLCKLFSIDRHRISFDTERDIRDSFGTPIQFIDKPFECDLETVNTINGATYKLFFAQSILQHPKRLLFNSIYNFLKIRWQEENRAEDENDDASLFLFLVGIHKGFGIVILQSMSDVGSRTSGFWEKKWNYTSEMPRNVMIYALALHYKSIDDKEVEWKNCLSADMRKDYDRAAKLVRETPFNLFDKQELDARTLFTEAIELSHQNDFDGAIEAYQKASFLTKSEVLKATFYNNIGYALLRKGEYGKSIPHFQKAIELRHDFGYAYDNIGFAFIMNDDPETGKHYLSLAWQTGKNEKAYSFRNLAIYHHKRNEHDLAETNFKNAFEAMKENVDMLEYLYAKFLIEQGKKETAINYLEKAVDKGEPEAIQYLKEITGQ